MQQVQLKAKIRAGTGKSWAKKLRRKGLVPSVLYGREIEPLPLQVDGQELAKILREGYANVIINLDIATDGENISRSAIIKEIQRHPTTDEILNVDFYRISLTEKLITKVPIVIEGRPVGLEKGGILQQFLREIEIECLPTHIPEHFTIDVSGLDIGDAIHVGDLAAKEGIDIRTSAEEAIAIVTAPAVEEAPPAEEMPTTAEKPAEG